MSAIEALRAARDLGVELTVARRGWLLPKIAPGSTGKSAFSKWFGRYIEAHGITDGTEGVSVVPTYVRGHRVYDRPIGSPYVHVSFQAPDPQNAPLAF